MWLIFSFSRPMVGLEISLHYSHMAHKRQFYEFTVPVFSVHFLLTSHGSNNANWAVLNRFEGFCIIVWRRSVISELLFWLLLWVHVWVSRQDIYAKVALSKTPADRSPLFNHHACLSARHTTPNIQPDKNTDPDIISVLFLRLCHKTSLWRKLT